MNLQIGQLVTALSLLASKEVELCRGHFLLEVVLQDDHHTFKALRITEDQFAQINILENSTGELSRSVEDFFFFIEANRIHLAYQFDPQLAVNISQVDPLHPPGRGGLSLCSNFATHPFLDRGRS